MDLLDNFIEREWRFILEDKDVSWLTEEQYQKEKVNYGKTKKPATDKVLKFDVEDVSFIIIKNDYARNNMIKFLTETKQIGGKVISDDKRNILISKILTIKEINENF